MLTPVDYHIVCLKDICYAWYLGIIDYVTQEENIRKNMNLSIWQTLNMSPIFLQFWSTVVWVCRDISPSHSSSRLIVDTYSSSAHVGRFKFGAPCVFFARTSAPSCDDIKDMMTLHILGFLMDHPFCRTHAVDHP